jgi:hypothetical protein
LRRRLTAWLGLGTLLFLQFAVAVYACTGLAKDDVDAPTAAAIAHSHNPCRSSEQQPSKLCEQHCLRAVQSVDTQPNNVPTVPHLPLIAVFDRLDVHALSKCDPQHAWLPTAVDPPPLVRFGVLRI